MDKEEDRLKANNGVDAVFIKRIHEIAIDFAEAESRTHNRRFAKHGFVRKISRPFETRLRKSPRLMGLAIKIRNSL
jgi:hypothetical protein